jgi:hypothetical protein
MCSGRELGHIMSGEVLYIGIGRKRKQLLKLAKTHPLPLYVERSLERRRSFEVGIGSLTFAIPKTGETSRDS